MKVYLASICSVATQNSGSLVITLYIRGLYALLSPPNGLHVGMRNLLGSPDHVTLVPELVP
jgi:hypothetical protein